MFISRIDSLCEYNLTVTGLLIRSVLLDVGGDFLASAPPFLWNPYLALRLDLVVIKAANAS